MGLYINFVKNCLNLPKFLQLTIHRKFSPCYPQYQNHFTLLIVFQTIRILIILGQKIESFLISKLQIKIIGGFYLFGSIVILIIRSCSF